MFGEIQKHNNWESSIYKKVGYKESHSVGHTAYFLYFISCKQVQNFNIRDTTAGTRVQIDVAKYGKLVFVIMYII
jgi:hypothetical protein